MAQKPLREAVAKELLREYWQGEQPPDIRLAAVGPETDIRALATGNPWLNEGKIVAKVDELFGKRGKRGYIKIADSLEEAAQWIESLRGQTVEIDNRHGTLNHFLIEPCVEHEAEYYLAFTAEREHDVILFSDRGGVDVEEQGDSIVRIEVPIDSDPDIPAELPPPVAQLCRDLLSTWRQLDFAFLEINPFTLVNGQPCLLDCVTRADSCAAYRQRGTWGTFALPDGFGAEPTAAEQAIAELDAKTGSSLKFVLLNPQGRIWTMVAGGGASVIYADSITAQTDATELANYGEWSGNPSTDEMESYTGQILDLMIENSTVALRQAQGDSGQALIIGGGIANFTDIAKTFTGIIRALRSRREALAGVRIYVRRAGPNDVQGLAALQQACDEMSLPCVTYGAELPMTDVVDMALSELRMKNEELEKVQTTQSTNSPILHS